MYFVMNVTRAVVSIFFYVDISLKTPEMSTTCRHNVDINFYFLFFWIKKNNGSFLGCSGPQDNARTIPEWLKKSLKKFEKNNCFY